jgi:signal transduction histidine kinase
MGGETFSRLVSLACHDLRTPLATVGGFAKTLVRSGELDERQGRFVQIMDEAAGQMAEMLEVLSLAARIQGDRYEPVVAAADTLALATTDDERVTAAGEGAIVETDEQVVARSLRALGVAAARHGSVEQVGWTVAGRTLTLAPLVPAAAPVVIGDEPKDLGALVACMALVRLGATVAVDGETLVVSF